MIKCYFLLVLVISVEAKMKKMFKVACVVKMKLFFYGLNLLLFDNTNYVMQNTIQKFRQSTIVLEKSGILSENLKTLTSSSYPTAQYFLLKLHTRFLLTNVYKRVVGIFIILFRSWVIWKSYKNLISTHSFFTLLLITQDLNKTRKIPPIFL